MKNTIIAVRGETFDSLALKLYGQEKYAAELLAANMDTCHLLRFMGGEIINVPEVDTTNDDAVPPWKRSA